MPDIETALTTALKEWNDAPALIKGFVGTPTVITTTTPSGAASSKGNPRWAARDPSGVSLEKRIANMVLAHPKVTYKDVAALLPNDKVSSVTSLLAQHARAGNMLRDEQGRYSMARTPESLVSLNAFKRDAEKAKKAAAQTKQPVSKAATEKPKALPATAVSPAPSPQIHDVFKRWTPEELLDAMPVRYAVRLRDALGNTFGG